MAKSPTPEAAMPHRDRLLRKTHEGWFGDNAGPGNHGRDGRICAPAKKSMKSQESPKIEAPASLALLRGSGLYRMPQDDGMVNAPAVPSLQIVSLWSTPLNGDHLLWSAMLNSLAASLIAGGCLNDAESSLGGAAVGTQVG